MKSIIKKAMLIATGAVLSLSVGAQDISKHEVSVYGAGGLSTLDYDVRIGGKTKGAGGFLGLGYSYSITDFLKVNTGFEFTMYNSKLDAKNFNYNYAGLVDDSEGLEREYDFYSSILNYEEKQTATYLNIPVMAQFSVLNDKIYLAGGMKFGVPVSGKSKSSDSKIVNRAYYVAEDNWALDQEFRGLGTFENKELKSDFDLKVACIASLEAGYKFKLKDNMSLYAGAYFDYGLNNLQDNTGKSFLNLSASETSVNFKTESMLNSKYMIGDETTGNLRDEEFTKRVKVMAAGVKVRLGLNLSK